MCTRKGTEGSNPSLSAAIPREKRGLSSPSPGFLQELRPRAADRRQAPRALGTRGWASVVPHVLRHSFCISHELRTPLQRIHIALDLAAEGDATIARESLVNIAEDLGELERIVDDVLTVTRLSLQDGGSSPGAVPPVP
jgi:signal transduction histidine kinase